MNRFLQLIFLILGFTVFSQISVSRSHVGTFKDLKKEDYKIIKTKKTVFVVDAFTVQEFEKMINSFWDLNKCIIVSRREYQDTWEKYVTDEFAIFEMEGKVVTSTSGSGMMSQYLYINYTYFYYTDIKNKNDKLKFDTNELASIFFAGDSKAMWDMIKNLSFGYLKQDLYNYKLGFMKNYLQFVNTNLKDGGYSFTYATEYDKKKIKALKESTLYVPDYINTKYNAFRGTDEERVNSDEIFKKYKYKYEFIDSQILNEKILNAKEDFYYLMYSKINSQKFVSVVNGKTGDIIYREYDTMSYNIMAKDLGELYSSIK